MIGNKRGAVAFMVRAACWICAASCAVSFAEVRSGFWTLLEPSSAPYGSAIDFSEYPPFYCSGKDLIKPDGTFSFDSIVAPGGVCFDPAMSEAIQKQFISGKVITLDREGLFYLDSMMKHFKLHAPAQGYQPSLPARKGVYFFKTAENRYAVLVKTGEYIGGINQTFYYWAYQPDSSAVLYKNRLFEIPSSLTIIPDVFSGLPNPVFKLTNAAGIAEIVHRIHCAVNTMLDTSLKLHWADHDSGKPGYRKLFVSGMFEPFHPASSYLPTLDICGGSIIYYRMPKVSSERPFYFKDPLSRLERFIIDVGCKYDLVDTLGRHFCDLVPDSLKTTTATGETNSKRHARNGFVLLRANLSGITCRIDGGRPVRFELFDIRGRAAPVTAARQSKMEAYRITFRNAVPVPGCYVLRCSRFGFRDGEYVVPVYLR